ncbi:uncharacterized protein LOC112454514 [Temnothorax curvispinosus]|uniref:Uncharacterized protein LOC112454514 n=1 Tax=Temnothorax curvispinosus TaxID=300111 RepID=A0A6J1PR05_9HYME|nr:uncharacterized protein LOC112454514 [Temnothorax curvispinosus]
MFIRTECEVEILEEYAEDDCVYDDNLLPETTIQQSITQRITECAKDDYAYDDNLLTETNIQGPIITKQRITEKKEVNNHVSITNMKEVKISLPRLVLPKKRIPLRDKTNIDSSSTTNKSSFLPKKVRQVRRRQNRQICKNNN